MSENPRAREGEKDDPSALIALYTVIHGTEVTRFTPNIRPQGIRQGNVEYRPWPVQARGFERSGEGDEDRPQIAISDAQGEVGRYLRQRDFLIGAILEVTQTHASYLDGGSEENPLARSPKKVYVISRKVEQVSSVIVLEMASKLSQPGLLLPRRPIQSDFCIRDFVYTIPDESEPDGVRYVTISTDRNGYLPGDENYNPDDLSDVDCPYLNTGVLYDRNGIRLSGAARRGGLCSKGLGDCIRYFGETNHNSLPFLGQPSVGRTQI